MRKQAEILRFLDEAEIDVVRLADRSYELPSQRKFKDSGAMIAPATIARTGIMEYSAGQLGKLFADLPPTQMVKVMTREEDLFCADSLESYRSAPITIGHPEEDVTVENAAELQHGNLDGVPLRDGEQLAGMLVLNTEKAVGLVEAGVDQLSSGHDAKLIRLNDEDAARLGYHAYKTNIRCNHIAIVPKGRAGNARIADEDEQGSGEPQGEGQVKMYDQEFVSGLQAQLAAAQESEASLKLKLADAELKLTDEAIEARVKERLDFLTEVTQFTDEDVTGMTAVEAKRVALKDSLGLDYADKDDAFINMRYSIMVEEGVPERDTDLTQALRDNANNQQLGTATVEPSAAELARQRMIDRQTARNS
ncbi:hypothetical protein PP651_gp44 [Aeromonas phage ZPAH14]|uniref:DUF2213 domain-containing protein n=1 Tax=Aeromonas phage ZPAH14 TaxID=2924887 RepID=A0AAE9H0Z9_9CAUD|nr:hypothetical protein PP651_gp44 [Aeromonas phage ZPAH14]UOT58035.1 hypothetical protein [Aeromonas phage ZPAH14]